METKEKIKVYAKICKGKTVCICMRSKKGCKENCEPEIVTRDKFAGWEGTSHRNKYST